MYDAAVVTVVAVVAVVVVVVVIGMISRISKYTFAIPDIILVAENFVARNESTPCGGNGLGPHQTRFYYHWR